MLRWPIFDPHVRALKNTDDCAPLGSGETIKFASYRAKSRISSAIDSVSAFCTKHDLVTVRDGSCCRSKHAFQYTGGF